MSMWEAIRDLALVFGRFLPPILPGLVAVYVLLPRPRAYPRLLGIGLAVIQLIVGAVYLVRQSLGTDWVDQFLFCSFSGLALLGGVLLVTNSNPARGAVSFTLVVLSTCGLFLLQGAPFLMAGTIIIYAGAIIVTFLFVIMLSQQHGPSDADARSREPLLACLAGGLLLAMLIGGVRQHYDPSGVDEVAAQIQQALAVAEVQRPNVNQIDEAINRMSGGTPFKARIEVEAEAMSLRVEKATMPAEARLELEKFRDFLAAARPHSGDLLPREEVTVSTLAGATPGWDVRARLPAANVASMGRTLYSEFLLAVELGGTLLLVATIGAIAITHRTSRRTA